MSKVASSYRVISDGNDTILSWQYPQGGAPIEQIRHVKQPVEFALSGSPPDGVANCFDSFNY